VVINVGKSIADDRNVLDVPLLLLFLPVIS